LRGSELTDLTVMGASREEQGAETVFGVIYPTQFAIVVSVARRNCQAGLLAAQRREFSAGRGPNTTAIAPVETRAARRAARRISNHGKR